MERPERKGRRRRLSVSRYLAVDVRQWLHTWLPRHTLAYVSCT